MKRMVGLGIGVLMGIVFMVCVHFGGEAAVRWFGTIALFGVAGFLLGIVSEM